MNRILLVKIHTVLAGFFLVTALLFLITGGLMTFGIKGGDDEQVYRISLSDALPSDHASLLLLVEQELAARGMSAPKGEAELTEEDGKTVFEWEGAQRTVLFAGTDDPMVAELTIENADVYGRLVNLHKAEGGDLFKYLAAGWAIGLLTLLITGVIMAWQLPKFRVLTLRSMLAGVLTFTAALLLS